MNSIKLVRDAAEHGGRDVFSCTETHWNLLLELGRVFGWSPRGTTYIPEKGTISEDAARHGYAAGDESDRKRIESEDAADWAAALIRARESRHADTFIEQTTATQSDEAPTPQAHFTAVLDEFIEYAYGGEFFFTVSSDED